MGKRYWRRNEVFLMGQKCHLETWYAAIDHFFFRMRFRVGCVVVVLMLFEYI